MDEPDNTEWWLWQMYRQVAAYVNEPTQRNELRLRALIDDYRNLHRQTASIACADRSADCR